MWTACTFRNLLLTYFLRFFDELVIAGHLYILETPLFRVRNKKVTRYCFSEKERDEAAKSIRGAEITRFKGLGEISANEFKPFISTDGIRLKQVEIKSKSEALSSIEFFMGRNSPERKSFIVDNLIHDIS